LDLNHRETDMIHELFAYLCVNDANAAIDYYTKVFGATEKFRLTEPGGRIGHAELDFDGITLMLSDEYPECDIRGPRAVGGTPVTIHLHVDNADTLIQRAVDAGATLEMAPADQFYGERSGVVRDPYGHRWNIGHSIETLSPEEMQRRYTAMMQA
jgi:PhnB protein